jgi:glycosidase
VGMNRRLEFFVKDTPPVKEKNEWFEFYKSLNDLKHKSKALKAGEKGGELKIYKTNNENVMVISRILEGEEILYIGNISQKDVKFQFTEAIPDGEFENYFTKEKISLPAEVSLAPWDFILLTK